MTTFSDAAALAGNALTYPEGRDFAVIVGANPSKGTRSVVLWNAAFKAHGIDVAMLPFDVSDLRLPKLLDVLERNPHCLGGAVAMPHKGAVARWLKDRKSREAVDIGAVNNFFRDHNGGLAGTNTDGEGAIRSFESRFGGPAGRRVLVLGLGGAGKAVAAFFRRAVGPAGQLFLSSRSLAGRDVAQILSATWQPWAELPLLLPHVDVLINCTSVGTGDQTGQSPLSEHEISLLPSSAAVFDVIYQPSPSALLHMAARRALAVMDGVDMNLEQAVLAYGYTAPAPLGVSVTRQAMVDAKVKLP